MKKRNSVDVFSAMIVDFVIITILMAIIAVGFGFTLTFANVFCVWFVLEFLALTYLYIKEGGKNG